MLPLRRSGPRRAPWQPTAFARLPHPSVCLHCWSTFMVGWVQRSFPRLSPISVPSFSPRGAHPLMRAIRHCFRSLDAGVARLRPRSARYPSSSGWTRTPWSLRQAPTVALVGGTSLSPEPRRLSPSTYLGFRRQAFNLAVLRATGASGWVWPHPAPYAQVCILPLLL
jgi:hypothetical protein